MPVDRSNLTVSSLSEVRESLSNILWKRLISLGFLGFNIQYTELFFEC